MPTGEPAALLSEAGPEPQSGTGGLLEDLFALYTQPGQLFARLPAINRAGAALALLLLLQVLYAFAVIATGVHDYEIDVQTEKHASQEAIRQEGEQKSQDLDKALETLEKGAIFSKLLTRVLLILGEPLRYLVSIGLIAGLLYLAVALQGGKPNFPVLAGICVFASWVEIPRMVLRLYLLAQVGASRVDTSAGAFVQRPDQGLALYVLLRQLDPFVLWFWSLVGLGLVSSGQLRVRAAVRVILCLVILACGCRLLFDVLEVADLTALTSEGGASK